LVFSLGFTFSMDASLYIDINLRYIDKSLIILKVKMNCFESLLSLFQIFYKFF